MRLWKNSKFVEKGDYFLVTENNKKYVSDAINNGAIKIISEVDDTFDIETIYVESVDNYLINYYKEIIDNIKLIGITGTNGKTTTCHLIYQMLNFLNVKTSYIGTIGFYLEDKITVLDNTTPSIDILYNLILTSYEKGCKVVVMEVSSHALKQDRIKGLLFDAIAVTNITRDHLDYHKNMKDYIKSKKKLTNLTKGKKICVLNSNCKYYKKFINKDNNNIVIDKDIKIKDVKMNLDGSKILLNNKVILNTALIGMFNIYNYLMAIIIINKLDYNFNKLKDNSNKFIEPKGRLEKIKYNNNYIFIDYAHTPDAVIKVLKTVKKIKNKGIITIIGCGGNRDKTKRPLMAKAACKYSSYVIFTNDNPRYEKEDEIMKDILKGAKDNYEVIYDRYKAIEKGIGMLKNKMILMVLGKGHEDYQIIEDKRHHFSDIETVNNIINKL